MNPKSERKLGVILQYVQMGLNILISLIYTPIMLNILGQAEYGIYSLANSIISYLSLLSLGFGASYIRFYSRYKKDNDELGIKRLNGLFLIVFLAMGVVALFGGLVLSKNVSIFFNDTYTDEDRRIAHILMIFMAVNLAMSFPTSLFTSYVTSQERFTFQKLLNMLKTVVSPLLTLPVLLLGYGSIGMVVVTTLVTICVDLSNIFFCLVKLKMRFDVRHPNFRLLKEIAVFSIFIAINQLVDQLNFAADKVILGKICTSSAVAIYTVGAQINTYYICFSSAISSVFAPKVNKIVASDADESDKNKQLTYLFTKVGRIQFIVLALILTGFIFFGRFFILKWAGEGYENSYYIALLLIVPMTVPLVQNLGIEIQRAKNKHQIRSLIYLGMAVFNIAISIFMAVYWGEIGAVTGTTISIVLANGIIMNIIYYKVIKIDVIHFWKEIVKFIPALIIPIAGGVCITLFYTFHGIGDFIGMIFAYIAVYCVSMYFFGLNKDEKNLVKKPIEKIRKRFRGKSLK